MEEKKKTYTEKLCVSTEEEFLQEARRRTPDLLKKNKIPGMAAICVHNGKVIWNESFGLADKKNNIPVSNQTVFELASISKTLTAWGVMKLVEQGIIELDESVCKYMKRWQFPEGEYDANKITFRMLLNHIAGLSQNYYLGYKKHHKLPSLEEAISYGGNQKDGVHIIYEPGTKLFYSGGGYLVLQLLIEEITGKEFSTYMKEEILDPLGMKDSTFEWNPEWKNREAKGYGILGGQMGKRFYVEKAAAGLYSTPNDFAKFIDIVKHFFSSKDNLYSKEDLQFYNNDGLYTIPSSLEGKPYDSKEFENAMVNAKINTLLTGTITQISDYYSITVDLYLYPSGKKIASISDVGVSGDFDLMCSNIARQLIPIISNSIPVEVFVNIQNEDIDLSTVDCFVDDILYKNFSDGIIVQSGVHYVQFVCPGYNSISTSYYFEGNKKYNIEVLLEKEEEKTLSIRLTKPISGLFYANGTVGVQDEWQKNKSEIKIDDKLILGNFISEFGENAFYYVPKNMIKEGENLSVNLKLYDKGDYVESRRKKMYFSYSLLMVSLIPSFVTYGNYYNEANAYKNGHGNFDVAKGWETGYLISMGVSIGCGVFFAYELIRYLIAANEVIPKKARYTYNFELEKESLLLKENIEKIQIGEDLNEKAENLNIDTNNNEKNDLFEIEE